MDASCDNPVQCSIRMACKGGANCCDKGKAYELESDNGQLRAYAVKLERQIDLSKCDAENGWSAYHGALARIDDLEKQLHTAKQNYEDALSVMHDHYRTQIEASHDQDWYALKSDNDDLRTAIKVLAGMVR